VFSLVLAAAPPSRDVRVLFAPVRLLDEAVDAVAEELGLPASWPVGAVREVLSGPRAGGWLELEHLRVFAPRPDYLLAMRCAALPPEPTPRDRDDLRFLLRILDLRTAEEALEAVDVYFSPRQVPPVAEPLLRSLLAA